VFIFTLASVVVVLLVFYFIFYLTKNGNISRTHSTTWQQKQAADLSLLDQLGFGFVPLSEVMKSASPCDQLHNSDYFHVKLCWLIFLTVYNLLQDSCLTLKSIVFRGYFNLTLCLLLGRQENKNKIYVFKKPMICNICLLSLS
jgi:hypothetical protein